MKLNVGFFFLLSEKKIYQNYRCFFKSGSNFTLSTHELSVLIFVLREKTGTNTSARACFSNLSCPLFYNPCHLRENSPPLTKTTVKSSCKLTVLNQTAHLYFIIWSKIFYVLCSKLKQTKAISGKVGWGREGTVQRNGARPAGFPSQVTGCQTCQQRWPKGRSVSSLPSPFNVRRQRGVLERACNKILKE